MKPEQIEEARIERSGDEVQTPSRRKFLRTSSATALVTSLASQPVWAACSAGSAASDASQDDSCAIPRAAVQSPDFWTQTIYVGGAERSFFSDRRSIPGVNSYLGPAIIGFPSVKSTDAARLRSYIQDVMTSNSYSIHPTSETALTQVTTIANALGTFGRDQHLAAIWLNAYFGFFDNTLLPGRSNPTPQDWVEHFYALSEIGGDDVFRAVYSSAATTAWTLPRDYSVRP